MDQTVESIVIIYNKILAPEKSIETTNSIQGHAFYQSENMKNMKHENIIIYFPCALGFFFSFFRFEWALDCVPACCERCLHGQTRAQTGSLFPGHF